MKLLFWSFLGRRCFLNTSLSQVTLIVGKHVAKQEGRVFYICTAFLECFKSILWTSMLSSSILAVHPQHLLARRASEKRKEKLRFRNCVCVAKSVLLTIYLWYLSVSYDFSGVSTFSAKGCLECALEYSCSSPCSFLFVHVGWSRLHNGDAQRSSFTYFLLSWARGSVFLRIDVYASSYPLRARRGKDLFLRWFSLSFLSSLSLVRVLDWLMFSKCALYWCFYGLGRQT